jgi:hypothetical protein
MRRSRSWPCRGRAPRAGRRPIRTFAPRGMSSPLVPGAGQQPRSRACGGLRNGPGPTSLVGPCLLRALRQDGGKPEETVRRHHLGSRTALVSICGIAVLSVAAGVAVASSRDVWHSPRAAQHKVASAKPTRIARLNTGPNATTQIVYAEVGVTLSPPVAGGAQTGAAAANPQTVLASFAQQPVPQAILGSLLQNATPSVTQSTVTYQWRVSSQFASGTAYQSWVVTYNNVPVQSYGPKTVSGTCPFIGIMDSATDNWTEFFQTCKSSSFTLSKSG